MSNRNKRKGFSLVELIIVVLILGALAAIAIPRITTSATTAKTNACKMNVDILNTQMELSYANDGAYPALAALVADANYFPDGAPTCPFGAATNPYVLSAENRVQDHGH